MDKEVDLYSARGQPLVLDSRLILLCVLEGFFISLSLTAVSVGVALLYFY